MNTENTKYNVFEGQKDNRPFHAILIERLPSLKDRNNLPWLIWVRLKMVDCDKDGLPTPLENITLDQCEDEFYDSLLKQAKAYYGARLTWDTHRMFYIYTDKPEKANEILAEYLPRSSRAIEYRIEKDTDWKILSDAFSSSLKV